MTEAQTAFSWKRTTVDGRAAQYGTIGEGLPVLFLHGFFQLRKFGFSAVLYFLATPVPTDPCLGV